MPKAQIKESGKLVIKRERCVKLLFAAFVPFTLRLAGRLPLRLYQRQPLTVTQSAAMQTGHVLTAGMASRPIYGKE